MAWAGETVRVFTETKHEELKSTPQSLCEVRALTVW